MFNKESTIKGTGESQTQDSNRESGSKETGKDPISQPGKGLRSSTSRGSNDLDQQGPDSDDGMVLPTHTDLGAENEVYRNPG